MTKIKVLSAVIFSDNSCLQPRQIIELEDEKALQLINANLAVMIEKPKAKKKVENTEETVATPPKKPRRSNKKAV